MADDKVTEILKVTTIGGSIATHKKSIDYNINQAHSALKDLVMKAKDIKKALDNNDDDYCSNECRIRNEVLPYCERTEGWCMMSNKIRATAIHSAFMKKMFK